MKLPASRRTGGPLRGSLLSPFLFLTLIGSLLGASSARATTFTVNSAVDTVDAAPGDNSCADSLGRCSLRAAIMEANAHAGADSITLPAGVFLLTATGANEDEGETGDLDISDSVTITGAGQGTNPVLDTIIQAGATTATAIDRVFDVNPDSSVTSFPINVAFQHLTIQNGKTTGSGGGIRFDDSNDDGDTDGSLALTDCLLQNNQSVGRGGAVNAQGGTHLAGNPESITITGSTVSGNVATNGNGGGLDLRNNAVTISNSQITGNTALGTGANGRGGGINLFNAPSASIQTTSIANNQAQLRGGGVYDQGNVSLASTVTVTGNKSGGNGGGIYGDQLPTDLTAVAVLVDGAVFSGNAAHSNITNPTNGSTINASSGGDGGAIFFDRGALNVQNARLDGNSAVNGGGLATAQDVGSPGQNGSVAITKTNIINNVASGNGGGASNNNHTLSISFSRVVGNSSTPAASAGVQNTAGTSTLQNNWWGCNAGPSATPCDRVNVAAGTANFTPWIILTHTASPSTIPVGGTATLTASFLQNSASAALTASDVAALVGVPVTFSNPVLGTISGAQPAITAAGTATATFTAGASPGNASADATVDSQTVTAHLTISKIDTTTTVSSDTNPSTFGQSVTFTATVAPASGSTTPTGTVDFKDGATTIGTGTVNASGQATFSTSALAVGSHSITAVYSGDSTYNGSTSAALTQVVNKADTTTTVASTPNPSVYGQPVTLSAHVSGPGGTPTGTVNFLYDATIVGSGTLNASGDASFTTSSLGSGTHTVTAQYVGDANYNGSTSADLSQTVNPANTTTTVSSDTNPSTYGQAVTFSATVTAVAPGAGIPSGTVDFKDGATTIGSAALDGAGHASLTTSALAGGAHTITAVYNGDSHFNGSTSATLTQTVNAAGTSTALASSPNPSTFGQSVTFTATVTSGAGTPTGTVNFKDGATTIGTGTLNASGQATFSTSALAAGSHSITAVYAGNGSFATSTSAAVTQVVNKSNTTTTLVSSVNPSLPGQSVTFTANVSAVAPGAGIPSGTVTFKDGAATIGTGTLNASGQATFSTSTLSVGSHTITAVYGGDANFNGSTSNTVTQNVSSVSTTTSLTSNHNPSFLGQPVTFTATVTPASGSTVPTGTVTFKDGAATIGTGALNASGVATFTTSTLSVGSHSITAVYSGDSTFSGATSAALIQIVNPTTTTTTVTSSVNPSYAGQQVTFTATVTGSAGTPTGTVTFKDGASTLGTGALNGSGQATFSTSSLSVGNHTITAVYGGDSNYASSTGTLAGGQTVVAAPAGILISEFRLSGPSGAGDEFIELYNSGASNVVVSSSDNSGLGGWAILKSGASCSDALTVAATVPNGAVIPAHGHYLLTGPAYSLGGYATGDLPYATQIDDDRSIGLFTASSAANASAANRLDAVGFVTNFGGTCDLLREGLGVLPAQGSTSQYSFERILSSGTPQDTNFNVLDFLPVSVSSGTPVGWNLLPFQGAPGPENAASPIQRNSTLPMTLLAPNTSATASPNQVRSSTQFNEDKPNKGTLLLRRKITNNTGHTVTKLRIRIADLATAPKDLAGFADLRVLSSADEASVHIPGGANVAVKGTTLEQPPTQPIGGGINSSVKLTLSSPLAVGASVYVSVKLGVKSNGNEDWTFNVEALLGP